MQNKSGKNLPHILESSACTKDISEKSPLIFNGSKQTTWSGFVLRNIVMILFAISFSTFMLCKPQFLYKRISDNLSKDTLNKSAVTCGQINGSLAEDKSQTEATNLNWHFSMVQLSISVPVIVILGIYSDVIGRKYCLFISLIANGFLYGWTALVAALDLPLSYLYIGYAVSGLGGAHFNFFANMTAAVADSTGASKSRSLAFAILYLSAGIGLSSSEFVEGYIIKSYGFVWPLAFASLLLLFASVLVLVFFKDEIEITRSGIRNILTNLKTFFGDKENIHRFPKWVYVVSMVGLLLFFAPNDNREDIETLMELRSPFCWDSQYVGWFQSAESAIHMLAGPLLIMILQRFFSDETIAVAGMVSGMAFYLMFAVAVTDWMIYAGASSGVLILAVPPCLKASLSKMVPPDFQGSLFAAVYLLSVISTMAGSTIFSNIYAHTQTSMHGLTFVVMAGFNLVALVCIVSVIAFKKSDRGLQITTAIININESETKNSA
ncbi:proton-coupled folate transporter-like [Mizuhopecten yessoensis]|uniref:Proton-coupled folate transporter n=1 Tax=Mizuhopecten yessoensis TaxID=6573 RepID=A0A210QBI7_MIZYE|nr:proton-coupled folate transporter-like [Mizuhopecten yessoensis]OWF46085.1 Proton-coupled folate transporter [Mizuhopecten yessoensis]